jgi:probable phosphoglycerate mutase
MPNLKEHSFMQNSLTPNIFNNQYFAMRHGQSEANVEGIIASDPSTGCHQYGLTTIGQQQVNDSLKGQSTLGDNTYIISSDFLRAKQTAEITHNLLNAQHPIEYNISLRERFFGELNGQSDEHYQDVWNLDKQNADHKEFGAESANQVVARVAALINQLEAKHTNKCFLLVAHGDVLQLLQTWFQHVSASEHRELPHLATAEIRCLNP